MKYITGTGNLNVFIPDNIINDQFSVNVLGMGTSFNFKITKDVFYTFKRYGQRQMRLNITVKNRGDYKSLIEFYRGQFGEFKRFWIPSFLNEFQLTRDIPTLSTMCYVKNNGFGQRYQGHSRCFIWLKNNDWIIRRITNVIRDSDDEEILVFDSPIPGFQIKKTDVSMFGLLLLVRFEGELKCKIQKADNEELIATSDITVIELPYEYEEV